MRAAATLAPMTRRIVPLLALVLLLLVAGCNGTGSARVTALLGGDAAYRLIVEAGAAESVTAYRLDPMGGAADARRLHGYAVTAGPIDVDEQSRGELASVLSSDGTYLWDIAKACEFMPGVLIRYQGGGETVDVLLCFSCDELEVYRAGKEVGHEDFDPRRADLVRVAKSLFPQDEAIAKLKP